MIKKILLVILSLVILSLFIGYLWLRSTAPTLSGSLDMKTLESDVSVKFDNYGIPHIYAENAEDCYKALGYVHAQDRLFQMEMIRRLSSGRLSEILGPDLIEADIYFRTLGLRKKAEENVVFNKNKGEAEMHSAIKSYLAGINEYLTNGKTPIEYSMIGIPKEEFTEADIYTILAYMGLGFTKATKEDPIISYIFNNLGKEYLEDWKFTKNELLADETIRSEKKSLSNAVIKDTEYHMRHAGVPLWYGSNGWVVSPERSKSGKVIFANDTHIGISQPSVWYEAHLNYPGYEFYGSFLAGVPFGIVGHNRSISIGLTIFPFDVLDLYRERSNPDNEDQVWVDDHWEDLDKEEIEIKVKDSESHKFTRKVSRHGPIFNEVSQGISNNEKEPISVNWSYFNHNTESIEALYEMNHATNIDEARKGVSKIDFIGLNVLYGDIDGNIAHWGAGKIPIRPDHVNSKVILDGASGKDEILGYYDFLTQNPISENPESGFVASANNDVGVVNGNYIPGYYCPDNRINRIRTILSQQEKWSQEEMKSIHLDEVSDYHKQIAKSLSSILESVQSQSEFHHAAIELLSNWDGSYSLDRVEPVIFTKLLYHTMRMCSEDELGKENFDVIHNSYLYKGSMGDLISNPKSIWWDNIHTKNLVESEKMIVEKALDKTIYELKQQLGDDINLWTWDQVHTIEHIHPIGRKKPFDKFFNVGPFPVSAGNDVPNKMMYSTDSTGLYKVTSSPALRILVDFSDVEKSENINPTGQSGNPMSPHYNDQAEMFINGQYRPQLMNHEEIEKVSSTLILKSK